MPESDQCLAKLWNHCQSYVHTVLGFGEAYFMYCTSDVAWISECSTFFVCLFVCLKHVNKVLQVFSFPVFLNLSTFVDWLSWKETWLLWNETWTVHGYRFHKQFRLFTSSAQSVTTNSLIKETAVLWVTSWLFFQGSYIVLKAGKGERSWSFMQAFSSAGKKLCVTVWKTWFSAIQSGKGWYLISVFTTGDSDSGNKLHGSTIY